MSMNGHCKRTIETLQVLDFRRDEDACRPGVYVYWHVNAPDQRVRVFSGISEAAARKARIKASDIAGLSSAGESMPRSISETARTKREAERRKKASETERHNREIAPFQVAADKRAARLKEAERIERIERERSAIAALMMPGGRRGA